MCGEKTLLWKLNKYDKQRIWWTFNESIACLIRCRWREIQMRKCRISPVIFLKALTDLKTPGVQRIVRIKLSKTSLAPTNVVQIPGLFTTRADLLILRKPSLQRGLWARSWTCAGRAKLCRANDVSRVRGYHKEIGQLYMSPGSPPVPSQADPGSLKWIINPSQLLYCSLVAADCFMSTY